MPVNLAKSLKKWSDYTEYNAIEVKPTKVKTPVTVEHAIITSKNAFQAIKGKVKIQNAFCVGKKTASLLAENNINIIEISDYASDLAKKIIQKHSDKEFIFFSGNLRQNTLMDRLQKENISIQEWVVYKTQLVPRSFDSTFDAILFFSPSTVKSFYQQNSVQNEIAFCIGSTTANEAKKYTPKTSMATQPSYENLVNAVLNYYKK